MKNIETKFYSKEKLEKSIKRSLIAYICFAATRIVLYLTLGTSISNDIVVGSSYFFYQDITTLFKLMFMGFVFILLLIASVTVLALCLNNAADLNDNFDIKKRQALYLIPMLLDIFGVLICIFILVIGSLALILGVLASITEIAFIIWLMYSENKDN